MKLSVAAALLALSPLASPAATVAFDDEGAFDGATAGIAFVTDDFSTAIAAADTITFASGVVSTNTGGERYGTDNRVSGGRYQNNVDDLALDTFNGGGTGDYGSHFVTWTLPRTVTALAFDYDSFKLGFTVVDVNGATFGVATPGAASASSTDARERRGFFGLTDAAGIDSLVFRMGQVTGNETFFVDDLRFGGAVAPVPLPAGLLLLGGALGALGLARRRAA